MIRWRLLGSLMFAGAALIASGAGCSSSTPENAESTGRSQSKIIGGTPTNDHPEVSFTLAGGGVGGFIENGAILLAPTLAVTQIQAVSKDVFFPPSQQGTVVPCATVSGLFDPSEITLIAGDGQSNPPDAINNGVAGTNSVVKQIITNGEVDTCKGPLAFIVLANPITTISSFPQLDIDNIPTAGEQVTQCGWGDQDLTCVINSQKECEPAKVTLPNGGYYAPNQIQFPVGQLLTDGNDCYDTSGAIYDPQSTLFAVMNTTVIPPDSKNTVQNPCGACANAITNGVLLSSQRDLLIRAFATIGSSPWRAGHPKPADVGGTCTDSLDCNTQMCVTVGDQGYCSQDCTSAACPGGSVCTNVDARNVCLPAVTPHPASCDVTPASMNAKSNEQDMRWEWASMAFIGLVLLGRSRSRAKRGANGKRES